VVKFERGRSLV